MEMRFLYPTFYMSSPLFASALHPGVSWVSYNVAQELSQEGINPAVMSSTDSDPAQELDYLKAVSGRVQNLGTARIKGVLTTHYHAVSDLGKYAALAPAGKRAAAEQGIAKMEQLTGTTEIPIDVWVDSRHLVRQIQLSFSGHPSTGTLSGQQFSEAVTLDMFNFGPKPAVAPPPASQTEDLSALTSGGL